MNSKNAIALKRGEIAVKKQELYALLNTLISVTRQVDDIMKQPETAGRGKLVAEQMNRLDHANDYFRHFQLGVPLGKTKKFL